MGAGTGAVRRGAWRGNPLVADQFDIFGGTQAPAPELPAYMVRDASVPAGTQSRLFEPQMEGQLTFEADPQLPTEGNTE